MMDDERDGGGGTGSARRRTERRLRSMLRHEQMAVAMALAESLHHSAQRPEKAKAKEVEEQDQHEAVASAMSSLWPSMSLCCRWWNSQWTPLRWLSSRRRSK